MNEIDQEFRARIERIREGDQSAAWDLLEAYGPHILRVVRRSLNEKLRAKFDSADFVQSVWASFFRDPGFLQNFVSPKQLGAFLMTCARNKVWDESRRRFQTEKHNIDREQSLDDLPSGEPQGAEPIDPKQHRPSEIAVARERWNQLMQNQAPRDQQIVDLRFRGASYEEIADSLNINERTARRVVNALADAVEN